MELHDRPGAAQSKPAAMVESSSGQDELAPADVYDPVIEAYKKDIDRTLLIQNLRLSVAQRLSNFQQFMNSLEKMRGAALPPNVRERLFGRND